METDKQIPQDLIIEGYYLHPKRLIIFKVHTFPDQSQVLLEPLNGQRYQVRVSPQALLEGGVVSRNLRLLKIRPEENDPNL